MLRTLWRRRTLVALVAVFAVGVGYLLAFEASFPPKSRSYTVGQARARILVDTPDSQVVEVAPKGTETLGTRASLLANLMVEGEVKASIAARAGLPPKRLIAFSQVGADPAAVSKLEGMCRAGPPLAHDQRRDEPGPGRAPDDRGRHPGSHPAGGHRAREGLDRRAARIPQLAGRERAGARLAPAPGAQPREPAGKRIQARHRQAHGLRGLALPVPAGLRRDPDRDRAGA